MILFVDDEPDRLENYREELEIAGYRVRHEREVDAALRFIRSTQAELELLVMDIMMPPGEQFEQENTRDGLDTGIFFINEVRQIVPDLPIIVLTNRDSRDLRKSITDKTPIKFMSKRDNFSGDFPEEVKTFLSEQNQMGRPPKRR